MKILRWLILILGVWSAPLASAEHPLEYRSYANGGIFPSIYRDDFAQTMKKYPSGRFARAYHGDRAALERYFDRALDASLDGRRSESLGYVLVKIMFGAGDRKFSRALRAEDLATRQAVGRNIDGLIARYKLNYPKTRGSYSYRAQPSA